MVCPKVKGQEKSLEILLINDHTILRTQVLLSTIKDCLGKSQYTMIYL